MAVTGPPYHQSHGQGAGSPTRPVRRKPGCLAWGVTLLLAVVGLCCVGGAGGAGLGWLTARPGEGVLPTAPAQFPTGATLPQFDSAAAADALTDRGFDCGGASPHPLDCVPPDLDGVHGGRVVAEFHDATGVRGVTVVCRPSDFGVGGCGELYALAIGGVLVDNPSDIREQAQAWAGQQDSDATTVIGNIGLGIREFGAAGELRITAA